MGRTNLIILEQDHARFVAVLDRLRDEANAKLVFLLDRHGQQVAMSGDLADVDSTSLASLAAGNVAATEGLANLVGERSFSTLFHEGERENLHLSLVADRLILLVVFDERSSLGLVRLRVQQLAGALGEVMRDVSTRDPASSVDALAATPLGEITDEDVQRLFG